MKENPAGIQPITYCQPPANGLCLKGRIVGAGYAHTQFRRKAAITLELILEKDGRQVLSRTYSRPGEASLGTLSWSRGCAESLDRALRLLLQHALPEFVDKIKSDVD